MKIQLFVTCLIDSFFPQVGEAVVESLERAGVEVSFPQGQTCCGQPAFNAGYWAEARRLASATINVFEATEGPLVIPSGSCADMIKHRYIELFREDPYMRTRAEALARRVYEYSEFLVDVLGVTGLGVHCAHHIAYHPSCHLLRGMGVDRQPRLLLQNSGAQVTPLEAECCGFGGVFALDYAEISIEMLKRKMAAIEASGAEVVAAGDVSCLMHIEGGLRKAGSQVRCMHVAQALLGGNEDLGEVKK